ncbi:hypothetical protein [Marinilabilia salmonicolor]|uniref:Uncharacterized protein n=1 Tax=Marinilabilia salmonicolor TaxID=989 RepID=A0A368UMJ7_9BACT|nr:hypothetical protein [Marinilabilia salmonicolor]RCW29992.1 hypothetical protein DFO77_1243 [Marinilabilia salmonicolor]
MKIDKETFFYSAILIGLVIYFIAGYIYKENSGKKYAIAYIYDFRCDTGPFPTGLGKFYINDKKYRTDIPHGSERLNKYFIVQFVKNHPKISEIKIEVSINPAHLVPQPPGGWTECPINENGSIKEKYKSKKGKEATEKTEVKGIEHSPKESVPVTKETIEFLKKNNLLE